MAKSKMLDLRNLSVDELIKTNESKRAELFALKFQAAVGSLEQTHRIKEIKKEIARIELTLSEKRLSGENTNKVIKADYNKAVEEAEKAGKEVRAKQRKFLEEQYGQQSQTEVNEADIQKAMQAAEQETVEPDTKGETK
ncbi:50S ribosomal protein L29 [Mycoplasma capricolum subsp. capripneumoniae]|uniref:50S ribosomal protein L29 n=1 Tax=Mycoplasma capricolum TaxID=2095 RepID=UPI0004DAFA14|nr:50S ribosomal protein L29 [Mycoplasma capricolum]KEY84682.1 50S ribosomal protein L29 [Mycoplasma capricolum subsp. capripneumoniae 99108]QDL19811.1 50S ribosomal protein L29 [Mycoplasma capricolum subsp. capripneumoniae]QDL20496.1 50S ribosomal protein L29 [Mycoplasma capricolum subsp. capripneumoniae]QDL21184.1 50S ribosomal protein L29 [Mycoplasma capricolum subsp. capripneumoniae]QIF40449.1 50S ribosomal protein L29 [Mycoplasma capricolum subsp. capripneumoniae]